MGGRANGVLKRRGLLAGAAAMVGAGLARLTGPREAQAGHAAPEDVLHLDQVNTTAGRTFIAANLNNISAPLVVLNQSNVISLSYGDAIQGITDKSGNAGVRGATSATAGIGVIGTAGSGGTGVLGLAFSGFTGQVDPGAGVSGFGATNGVRGQGSTSGVRGESFSGTGVYGTSERGVGAIGISRDGAGVYGFSTNAAGAYGKANTNAGLFGESNTNAGVFGASTVYGVWGRTNTGFGVNGQAVGAGIGVYGTAGPGGFAGYFDGNVYVSGTVTQGGAASPQASSAQAAAQTVESFGTGKLSDGQATVTLGDEFVTAADGTDYAVVVTEEEDSGGLYVTGKGAGSFQLRARKPAAGGAFSFRVVAKRKVTGRRAGNAEAAPQLAMPKDVPVPTAPELPTVGTPKPKE